jgi:nucleotide-binding universal stress UspA family protein
VNITAQSSLKTILCTIDFSQSTRHSLEWAVSMARQLRAHLSILYTYRLIQSSSGEIVHFKRNIELEARQKFEILEKECLLGKGISYDFKIEVGFVSDRIEDQIKKNSPDFIIMGKTLRANGNESFEELMEHIHVPMLVVP